MWWWLLYPFSKLLVHVRNSIHALLVGLTVYEEKPSVHDRFVPWLSACLPWDVVQAGEVMSFVFQGAFHHWLSEVPSPRHVLGATRLCSCDSSPVHWVPSPLAGREACWHSADHLPQSV